MNQYVQHLLGQDYHIGTAQKMLVDIEEEKIYLPQTITI